MTWTEFTNYLKDKIFLTTQEEYNLTPFAKEKYGTGLSEEQITDLEANLNYLLLSHKKRFNSLSDNFHQLPEIEKEEAENSAREESGENDNQERPFSTPRTPKKVLKDWIELYPTRQDCLLGESGYGAVSFETYNLLGRIYEDWRQLGEKAEELKKKTEEWEKKSGEWMKEWVSQKVQNFFRKKGIKALEELKQWMADYESLDKKQQDDLEEEHKKIKEQLEFLEAETSSGKTEEKGWLKNLDWKSIVVSTGIGVILILLVLIIRRYLKI